MKLGQMLTMDLHEEKEISSLSDVMRVPGGWIYKFYEAEIVTTQFVPLVTTDGHLNNGGAHGL